MSRKDPSLSPCAFVESWVLPKDGGGVIYIESWRPDCQRRARERVTQIESATRNTSARVSLHTGPSARVQVGSASVRGLLIRVVYEGPLSLPAVPAQDRRPLARGEEATC